MATLVVVTGAATQIAQVLLSTPRYAAWLELTDGQIGDAAFPSGHATAAMTLALCAVLVAPAAWRMLAMLMGWAFAAAMSYAVVALTWHYPSDVLGGYLMAGFWASLALAATHALEKRPVAARPHLNPQIVLGVAGGLALTALAVLAARGYAVTRYPAERPTLLLGALAITALSGALAAACARTA